MSLDPLLFTNDIWLLAIMLSILLFAGAVKGFLGIGLPTTAMALLTLVIEPTTAISLLAVSIIATNGVQYTRCESPLYIAKKYWLFGISIIVSIFFTSLIILSIPTEMLMISIGFSLVVFSLTQMVGKRVPISASHFWHVIVGLFAGVLGGMSSIWSPPVVMYLVNQNVTKEEFIGATGFLFFISSIPLAMGLTFAGVLTFETTLQSISVLFIVMVGFWIGEQMRSFVPQGMFKKIVLWVFLIMGFRLIVLSLF
ncbi:sulfite exporter TauE/SafE family protein [Candidatus Puniceispirillum sp.]|nr:sulfite exporter TauE/SafE family protein [Candidatus Puniceispirillum sp.]